MVDPETHWDQRIKQQTHDGSPWDFAVAVDAARSVSYFDNTGDRVNVDSLSTAWWSEWNADKQLNLLVVDSSNLDHLSRFAQVDSRSTGTA